MTRNKSTKPAPIDGRRWLGPWLKTLDEFRAKYPGRLEELADAIRPPVERDEIEQDAKDAYEARRAHKQLDDLGVRRALADGTELSLTGRINLLEIALSPERHDV